MAASHRASWRQVSQERTERILTRTLISTLWNLLKQRKDGEADETDLNSQTESTYSLNTSKWAQNVKLSWTRWKRKLSCRFFEVPRPRNSKPRYSSSLWLDWLGGKGGWKNGHCSAANVSLKKVEMTLLYQYFWGMSQINKFCKLKTNEYDH